MVTCKICGKQFKFVNNTHMRTHGINITEYIRMYPGKTTSSDVTTKKKSSMSNHMISDSGFKSKCGRGGARSGNMRWYGLRSKFPHHCLSFKKMHDRSSDIDPDFSRTTKGLINFIRYIGPVPVDVVDPSVGRDNHSIGYHKGNFAWQSMQDNRRESYFRNEIWKHRFPNSHF